MTTTSSTTTGPALRRIRDGYWRVTAASGLVLGYVEQIDADGELRFAAKRLLPSSNRVVGIGDFHSRDEAAECLR